MKAAAKETAAAPKPKQDPSQTLGSGIVSSGFWDVVFEDVVFDNGICHHMIQPVLINLS